jgi:hypothetical protein
MLPDEVTNMWLLKKFHLPIPEIVVETYFAELSPKSFPKYRKVAVALTLLNFTRLTPRSKQNPHFPVMCILWTSGQRLLESTSPNSVGGMIQVTSVQASKT